MLWKIIRNTNPGAHQDLNHISTLDWRLTETVIGWFGQEQAEAEWGLYLEHCDL
jgi:hypothetical protein